MAYAEHARTPVRRREIPGGRVPVIISFGDTIQVTGLDGEAGRTRAASDGVASRRAGGGADRPPLRLTSFVPGFHDVHAITEYTGPQRGIQVDLTPVGAFRLLGLAGADLHAGAVDLADVWGRDGPRLVDRLVSAPDWPTRFGIVDAFLLQRAERGRRVVPAVAWSWESMRRTDGRVVIGELVREIGWSRRHFVEQFRHHVGMGPKATARVLRFARAARMLDGSRSISDVAADCGYADHSHLVRDVQAMAGCTPTELMAEQAGSLRAAS